MYRQPLTYTELLFNKDSRQYFSDIIDELVPQSELYYSPAISYISGNVANELHCTLIFGIEEELRENPELQNLIKETKLDEIKLGKLTLADGYQGLYKILWIEIDDTDNKLKDFIAKFDALGFDRRDKTRDFQPHLTLAYVKNEFTLPEELPEIKKSLPIYRVQIA